MTLPHGGIALTQRDLAATRGQLQAWFEHRFTGKAAVSELRAANKAAGWSSESLVFSAEAGGSTSEYVIGSLLGGGIFPQYGPGTQTLTQEFLHEHGIPPRRPSSTNPTATGSARNSL